MLNAVLKIAVEGVDQAFVAGQCFKGDRVDDELKGETLKYDKKERSLVLEFPDIRAAVEALNILPFGINYKIYLLDV